jgi:4-hydroxythreonine-4-phosphate dehydrogenase
MVFISHVLKVVLLTRHMSLIKAAGSLNKNEIFECGSLVFGLLKNSFKLLSPKVAVCGLNPHASDNGIIGKEENETIKPVIGGLKKQIKHLDGPVSADVAISRANKGRYDCVIAMYHDQALIPLKLLSPASGVNMTLGLGYVRTSPLHGTAFDIAGKDSADPSSLIEAIKLAVKCAANLKKT